MRDYTSIEWLIEGLKARAHKHGEDIVLERPRPRIVASRDSAGVVTLRKQEDDDAS
jgi:hypothetical protein